VLTTEEILEDILSLFSDAKPDFVRQLLEKWKGKGDQANRVCNYLLENKDYPRVERVATRTKQPAIQVMMCVNEERLVHVIYCH
jgi:uncharacterized protein YpiB (UPF0302 family)